MNILMVGPSVKLQGGVATVVKNYLESNLAREFNIKYIDTVKGNNKIYKLYCAINSYFKVIYSLLFNNIDLIHIHLASRGSFRRKKYIIYIARILNKKILIQVHGAEFNEFYHIESGERKKKEIRNTLNKANCIIALSNKWKNDLSKITNSTIYVVHNSVNINETNYFNMDSKNILFLGRLEKRKGIFDLLDVIEQIIIDYPEYKFLLCGDGDVEEIKKIIKKKNINKNTEVLGWISGKEKVSIMKDCLINVLPSYNEGLPMSILEAMSYGIPTISTNVGGIPDVIKNMENGLLINPGDKQALREDIEKVLVDFKLRKKISESSYNTINNEFNLNKNIEYIKNIYNLLTT